MIKKFDKTGVRYFQLSPNAYFENDSTIIIYAPPFKSNSDDDGIQKNGLWLYSTFYEETKTFLLFFKNTEGGVRFAIDSMPAATKPIKIPTREGIYLYKEGELVRMSAEQSEDKFYELKTNGFYFFPNSDVSLQEQSLHQ